MGQVANKMGVGAVLRQLKQNLPVSLTPFRNEQQSQPLSSVLCAVIYSSTGGGVGKPPAPGPYPACDGFLSGPPSQYLDTSYLIHSWRKWQKKKSVGIN